LHLQLTKINDMKNWWEQYPKLSANKFLYENSGACNRESCYKKRNIMKISYKIASKIETIRVFFRYDIIYGINNLRMWFKIIWNDRDYDYMFLMILIKFKLKRMVKLFKDSGDTYVGQEKDVEKINLCINLIERITGDVYHDKIFVNHEKKWGKLTIKDKGKGKRQIKRENVHTKDDEKLERSQSKRLYADQAVLETQDLKLLYKTLLKNMIKWWI